MADYYPLLAKAIAAQAQSDPEKRRVIYERARKALLAQLRAVQPPIADTAIERESHALDDAITQLEGELGTKDRPAPPPPTRPARESATPGLAAGLGAGAIGLAAGPTSPRMPPRPPLPPRPSLRMPVPKPPAASTPAAPPARDELHPPSAGSTERTAFAASSAADSSAADSSAADLSAAELPPLPAEPQGEPGSDAALRPRDRYHPAAPRPDAASRRTLGPWIAGAVGALLVLLIAGAAWKLRDRPEDLARVKPAAPQSDTSSAKVAERVGGARPSGSGAAATQGAPAAPADQASTVPVAHRAALLVEAPEEENKVKTYIGSVVWRLENVSREAGQPLSTAVRADVDIPDAKLKMSLTFQKNLDPALPASHTISIRFTPLAGSPLGDVQQIDSPQMRRDEAPSGDPLSAVPVPIMDNNFLVGLARGDFESRNLDLMKTRAWIDIPMLLKNKHVAKLTLEKGVTGDRAINDAIAAWAGQ